MSTTIDLALALYLLLYLPGMALWRSLRPSDRPRRTRPQRYLATIREIALLLLALAAVCWWNGHTPAALGLAAPVSGSAFWALIVVAVAFPALHFGGKLYERKMDPAKLAASQEKVRNTDSLPRTPAELRLFIVMSLFVGIGWELLYRGFLMLALSPWTGTWSAVVLAAVAYGAAHGYDNRGQFIGSIVSALLFTAGYALTGSLWWLMLVHVTMPLSMALYGYKIARDQQQGQAAGGECVR